MTQAERNALVIEHRTNADRYAWRIARRAAAIEHIDDVKAEAMAGLVDASLRFDPARGVRFMTFAAFWIRMRTQRYLADHSRAVRPPHGSTLEVLRYKIRPTEHRLTNELQRLPTRAEMAAALGCTEQAVIDARWRRPDVVVAHGDYVEGEHVVGCRGPSPYNNVADDEERDVRADAIASAMGRLDARERAVIRRRFLRGRPETLAEIAVDIGVSRERVRQIEARALAKLRRVLAEKRADLMESAA